MPSTGMSWRTTMATSVIPAACAERLANAAAASRIERLVGWMRFVGIGLKGEAGLGKDAVESRQVTPPVIAVLHLEAASW